MFSGNGGVTLGNYKLPSVWTCCTAVQHRTKQVTERRDRAIALEAGSTTGQMRRGRRKAGIQ